ncbi:hypothetical protein, partial [Burkholderia gladioli]
MTTDEAARPIPVATRGRGIAFASVPHVPADAGAHVEDQCMSHSSTQAPRRFSKDPRPPAPRREPLARRAPRA